MSSVSFLDSVHPGYENFKIGGPEAGQLIRELQGDYTWNSRMFAMQALAVIGDPRAVEPLCKILTEQDAASRANPISYSAKDKYGNASSLAELKAQACETLGTIGDRRAVDHLITATMDGAEVVRCKAIKALGKIKDKRAVESLLSALTNGSQEAACALGEIGDQRAVESLIKTLVSKYSKMRACSAEALGQIGDLRALHPLRLAQTDDDEEVRSKVTEALGKIKNPECGEQLIEALSPLRLPSGRYFQGA